MKSNVMLQENEQILFEGQPQKHLAIYLMFAQLWRWLFLGIFFLIFFVSNLNEITIANFFRHGVSLGLSIGIVVVLAAAYLWGVSVTKRHYYIITNQRCILYSGFWGITKKMIPYRMITDVDLRVNPIQGMLGISAIYLVTTGISGFRRSSFGGFGSANFGGTVMQGLTHEQAENIMNIISTHLSKQN